MAKKAKGKRHPNKVYKAYKVEGQAVNRLRKSCPKCGTGVFLAKHKSRSTCGKCSYTEFEKKEAVPKEKKVDNPAEKSKEEKTEEPKSKAKPEEEKK